MSVKKRVVSINFSDICGNRAPVIASGTQSQGLVVERADLSPNENTNPPHIQVGNIKFRDLNARDFHKAIFAPLSVTNDGVSQPLGPGAFLGSFVLGKVNQVTNAVTWKFSVNDSAIDFLAVGQTIIQKYKITISDGHGGKATQIVAIRIIGTNDAPEIQVVSQNDEVNPTSGFVVEDINVQPDGNLIVSNVLDFDDVDLIDTHTASATKVS